MNRENLSQVLFPILPTPSVHTPDSSEFGQLLTLRGMRVPHDCYVSHVWIKDKGDHIDFPGLRMMAIRTKEKNILGKSNSDQKRISQ